MVRYAARRGVQVTGAASAGRPEWGQKAVEDGDTRAGS